MGGNDRNLFSIKSTPAGAEVLLNGNIAYLIGQEVNLILEAQDMDASRLNISPKVRGDGDLLSLRVREMGGM